MLSYSFISPRTKTIVAGNVVKIKFHSEWLLILAIKSYNYRNYIDSIGLDLVGEICAIRLFYSEATEDFEDVF
jgi:hypothetical protein